jgi:hypothetical protein
MTLKPVPRCFRWNERSRLLGGDGWMTGDEKDFGRFFGETIEGVKVVSPKLLAEELTGLGRL